MRFRVTLTMDENPSTYTVEGWELLQKHIEALEVQKKKWVVTKG